MPSTPEPYPLQEIHFFYVIWGGDDGRMHILPPSADLQHRLESITDCGHVGLFVTHMKS